MEKRRNGEEEKMRKGEEEKMRKGENERGIAVVKNTLIFDK